MNFTHQLRVELDDRQRRNPNYSLRAFANHLGISASYLSRLLEGKRAPSMKVIRTIAQQLGWTMQLPASNKAISLRSIGEEVASHAIDQICEDWCAFAILELLATDDFQADCAWIAHRLNVKKSRVESTVKLMQDVGFLEIQGAIWHDKYGDASIYNKATSSTARRQAIRSRLQLAISALDDVAFTEREHAYLTLAMHSNQIEQAKKILKKCRQDLLNLAASASNRDSVFHVDMAFFPVTKVQG